MTGGVAIKQSARESLKNDMSENNLLVLQFMGTALSILFVMASQVNGTCDVKPMVLGFWQTRESGL